MVVELKALLICVPSCLIFSKAAMNFGSENVSVHGCRGVVQLPIRHSGLGLGSVSEYTNHVVFLSFSMLNICEHFNCVCF